MKYFVTSDIHSHFKELKKALEKLGYDASNDSHMLVVCGDIFDRGDEPLEVYNFLRSIPSNNRILIKGNHDYLFLKLFEKDKYTDNDIDDGTVYTMYKLAGKDKNDNFLDVKKSPIIIDIVNWMKSDEWISYYEAGKYIFTHSFIPLRFKKTCFNFDDPDIYHDLEYDPNWRSIDDEFLLERCAFDSAWRKVDAGLFDEEAKLGKILVCGHTHSYEFFAGLDHKEYDDGAFEYGIYNNHSVINLDSWVERSKLINVLVIDIDD